MANESLSTWRQISWCLNKSIVYFPGAPTLASRSVSRAGNLLHHSSYWGWLSTSPGYGHKGRAHPMTFRQMSSVLLGKFLTALLMISPVPFLLLPNFSLKSSSKTLWPKGDPKDNIYLLPLSHHWWAAQHRSFLSPVATALYDWWHLAMTQHDYSLQRDVSGLSHLHLHKPSHTMAYLTLSLLLNALSEPLNFYASYSAPDFGFSILQNASTFSSPPQSLVCLVRASNDHSIVMCMCVYVSTYKHTHHHT